MKSQNPGKAAKIEFNPVSKTPTNPAKIVFNRL